MNSSHSAAVGRRSGALRCLGTWAVVLTAALARADAPGHAGTDQLAAEAAALLPREELLSAPPPAGPVDASVMGAWTPLIAWTPHIPVHAALLPDGRLLTFASNKRTTFPDGPQFTYAAVWDPETGLFTEINNPSHDMFCGGMSLQQDGRLLVNGGNGITGTTAFASLFDWRTNQWTRVQTMSDGRWYNTSVGLPSGEVFTAGGHGGGNAAGTIEQWNAATGWRRMSGIPWETVTEPPPGYAIETNLHPFLLVAPDGRLAHFGPHDEMHWLSTSGSGGMTAAGATIPGTHYPKQGAWAMYEQGRVMVTGGLAAISDGTVVNHGFKVDLNGATPVVAAIAPMTYARSFSNAVVLPNGEVMIVGGTSVGEFFSDAGTIYTPEIWNPESETWRPAADIAAPRNYHSLALLLTDGRVWSGGGGLGGIPETDHRDAQIFTPPQLFNADGSPAVRPEITAAPARIGPGVTFRVNASPDVSYFSCIRLSSLTHSVNTDQRHLRLSSTAVAAGAYDITTPASPHVLTPGYWMLYAVNSAGAWSVSRVIQVTAETLPVVTHPGDQSRVQGEAVALPIQATTGSGTLSYSASGLPQGLGIDAVTGMISGILAAQPGTYQSTIHVSANGQDVVITLKWIVVLPNLGSGQISREWWTEIAGETVASLTNDPSYPADPRGRDYLGAFDAPRDWEEEMGQRVRGFLHVPVTGQYRFYISSDDESVLRLSTTSDPAAAVEMASVPDYTDPESYNWYPQQTSALVTLQAGTRCYIEALMKEGGGGDHLTVAWRKPGDTVTTTIAGTYLSPYLPANEPAVRWSFDETVWSGAAAEVRAAERSLYGLHGSAAGASTSTTGPAFPGNPGTFRYGVFNGSDQSVIIPYAAELNPGDFTLAAWVRADAAGGARCVFSTQEASGTTPGGYSLWIDAAGQWQFRTGTAAEAVSGPAVETGQWTHVAVTFRTNSTAGGVRSGVRRLFIDGQQVAESTGAYTPNSTRPLVIGASGSPGSAFFQGGIDEVTLLHQPLSSADITALRHLRHNLSGDQSPVITAPAAQTTPRDAVVSLAIQALDPEGGSITFSASGLPPGLSISPASGVITGTATSAGSYHPVITVTDGTSTPAEITFAWEVTAGLALEALGGLPQAVGASLTFTATATGGLNPRFKWNFGDGSAETAWQSGTSITHAYAAPGRYIVTLTATDDSGRIVTRSYRQAVHAPLTAALPRHSTSILHEAAPAGGRRLWCVNPDNDSVSVFDAVTRVRLAEIPVGRQPRTLALAPDGRLWVVNVESASLSIIDTTMRTVTALVPLPRGSRPFGLVFDPAGTHGWLALEGSRKLLRLDPLDATTTGTLALPAPVRHLSLSADGARLYGSRFISAPVPGENTATPDLTTAGGEVVVIDTAGLLVESTLRLHPSSAADTETSARGLPNYLGAAVISPDGLSAWVPSKQDNIQRGLLRDGRDLNHENTLRSIVSRLDLVTQAEDLPSRVDIDNAGMPSAVAFDPWGAYLFVALEAGREVAVLDAWSQAEVIRFPTGRAPQGLAVSPDGGTLYVQNFMDRSVSVHDVSSILQGGAPAPVTLATMNAVTTEALSPQVLQGKQLFYDAKDPRLAAQEYMSCATCHHDGGHDGRVWDLTGFGEGLRNTITLRGHAGQGPLHWSGNFDEVQDFETQIRALAGGSGLIAAGAPHPPLGAANGGRSADLDAMAAYVNSLASESDSPVRAADGGLSAEAAAGRQIFRALQCAECHGGSRFTNSAPGVLADIGTLLPSSGFRLGGALTGLDVPTLRGVHATAPYLHDGRAATLGDAILAHPGILLNPADLAALASYVESIDALPAAAPEAFHLVLGTDSTSVSGPFVVNAYLSDPAGDFTAADVVVTNGTLSDFTGSGTSYSWTVTPGASGRVTVRVPPAVATDGTLMPNLASNVLSLTHTAITRTSGVQGDYYLGKNFETFAFTRIDDRLEFDWAAGTPDPRLPVDNFSVRWTGFIVAPVSGTYDLVTRSDDGIRLYVDGALMIDNWTNHGETWDYATVTLTAGLPVPFVMEYYEATGGAMARLWWEGPGLPFSSVPGSAFQVGTPAPAGYPSSFSDWLASPLAPTPGAADADSLPDLMEYALGTSATSGMQAPGKGLHLLRGVGGGFDAHVVVPSNITDIRYDLETSVNLVDWTQSTIVPLITADSVEWTRITWPSVPPFVRLRVTQSP